MNSKRMLKSIIIVTVMMVVLANGISVFAAGDHWPDPFVAGDHWPDPFTDSIWPDPFVDGIWPDPFTDSIWPDPFVDGIWPDPFIEINEKIADALYSKGK